MQERRPVGRRQGTIGIAGPVTVSAFEKHLDGSVGSRPEGLGGIPVTDLVTELLARGNRVVVVTLSRDVTHEVVLRGPSLTVRVGPYRPTGRARDFFRVERTFVREALRAERPEVVHAHWAYEFALGSLSSGHPTLVTLHDWAPSILRFHLDGYRLIRLLMQVATLRRGKDFTTVSPYIVQRAGRWRKAARLIPNGLADKWFDSRTRQCRVESPRIISVNAGFGDRKNSASLLKAFQLCRTQHPEAKLILIGDGHGPDGSAFRWAREHGLLSGVDFLGPRPHPECIAAMGEADLLVHPSLEESFGMTLIEAMAQGTPVVGGRNSGAVPWVLAEGKAGRLVDVADPQEMAGAIAELLSDPELWGHYSRAGYEHVWAKFRLSAVVDQYLEAYTTLIAARRTT